MWLLRRRHPGAPREEGRPVGREGLTRHRGLALLLAAGCLSATPALAELYKWTDTAGVVYYTSDLASIPPAFRDSATPISTPQARPAQPAKSEPAALRVTAGAPITAEARLNGVPLTLIVDTGADRTVIAPDVLERAGLGGQGGRPVQVVGITGVSTATLVTVPMLDVAGARIGPLAVIALALPPTLRAMRIEGAGEVSTGGVDGLLGRDVLDAFTLSVDTASGRATLNLR
ncbi:MAG TPA: aspartyl protease family protein [Methylomirabilota bacterium]|nr:aspartyl protease family protein [Methylomirabilota bacterium]